jgi:hypothetical protein
MNNQLNKIVERAIIDAEQFIPRSTPNAEALWREELRAIITRACEEYFDAQAPKHFAYLTKLVNERLDELQQLREQLEIAWGVIANAGDGDWDKESRRWQDAAIKWRDSYFSSLPRNNTIAEQPNTHRPPNQPEAIKTRQ